MLYWQMPERQLSVRSALIPIRIGSFSTSAGELLSGVARKGAPMLASTRLPACWWGHPRRDEGGEERCERCLRLPDRELVHINGRACVGHTQRQRLLVEGRIKWRALW